MRACSPSAACAAALLFACAASESPPATQLPPCDALDPHRCALPYPSAYFEAAAETRSGVQLAFPAEALPVSRDGDSWDPTYLDERDGYSVATPIYTYFPGVSLDGTIPWTDIGRYDDADALTVVVDAATGRRVPHWVERDDNNVDEADRLLVLRLAEPLAFATRYVVGIRGMTRTDGAPVDVSEGFQALRDGSASADAGIEARRHHFEDVVFPTLDNQGFARDELVLAWDFVTASDDDKAARTEMVVADALAFSADGVPYAITSITDGDCNKTSIARAIEGTFTAPLYTEDDGPGTLLTRGDGGLPYRNGTTTAEFSIRVPCSLWADPRPGLFLEYGHGLFYGREEIDDAYLGTMADEFGWVLGAADFTGMKKEDEAYAALMLGTDLTRFPMVPERTTQGFAEHVVFMELVTRQLAADPALQVGGVPLLDPGRVGYFGNSQGGILGAAYLTLSPHHTRGVLGVAGLGFSMMALRSHSFDGFMRIAQGEFPDQTDVTLLLGMLQPMWDIVEGAGWATLANRAPRPGMPEKQAIVLNAIGDASVPTLAGQVLARAFQARTVAPESRPVFGIEEATPGFTGSALVEWSYEDGSVEPLEAIPPDGAGDTHQCPRREPAAQKQIRDFLETGIVNQYCEGVCSGVREGFCD